MWLPPGKEWTKREWTVLQRQTITSSQFRSTECPYGTLNKEAEDKKKKKKEAEDIWF